MSRFAWWRKAQRAGSRSTAPTGASRHGSVSQPLAAVLPDSDSRLSDGIVVEARLKARLLGAPVLRVDGIVLLSPGRLVDSVENEHVVSSTVHRPSVNGAPGTGLARAARLLADNDADIERWHRGAGRHVP
jgi:hypothetical protein